MMNNQISSAKFATKRSLSVLLTLTVLFFLGCVPTVNPPSGRQAAIVSESRSEVLRLPHDLGWGGQESADPASSTPFNLISMLVHAGLVRFDENNELAPDLARKWSSNSVGDKWHFFLRENVTFHNGSPLTAHDVVFTFERILALGNESPLAAILNSLERVEAVDDYIVTFHLKKTEVDFPLLMADRRMRILSQEADPHIGAGPFQIVSYEPRNITTLRAFDAYWAGSPKLERVEIIAIPERQSQIDALDDGAIHMVERLTPEDLAFFEGQDRFEAQTIRTGDWRGFVFRTDTPPFDDIRVRRAVRLVVDREEMIALVANGRVGAEVACDTPVWSGDQYYADMSCGTDIVTARALLAAAGYDDDNPLSFTLTISDLDTYWQPMAEVINIRQRRPGSLLIFVRRLQMGIGAISG